MSSVETGSMSSVEAGQMSAAKTGQVPAACCCDKTHAWCGESAGPRLYSRHLVSTACICPVSGVDICPVFTEDICLVSREGCVKVSKKHRFSFWHRRELDPHPQLKAYTTRTLRSRSRAKAKSINERKAPVIEHFSFSIISDPHRCDKLEQLLVRTFQHLKVLLVPAYAHGRPIKPWAT